MKIRILGSGYGVCRIKKMTSKDYRGRGGTIIDEKLLIDAPHDIFTTAEALGFSDIFYGISDVLITHSHEGHFSAEAVLKLSKLHAIRIYASEAVLELLPEDERIEKIPLIPFFPVQIDSYKVIPLPSNHETQNPAEECFNFIISSEKTCFYALDGGFLNFSAYKVLKGLKIDAVIADIALGINAPSGDLMVHGNFDSIRIMKDILIAEQICTPSAKFILSHIPTDKKTSIHELLSSLAAEYGIATAYDGYFCTV